MPDHKTAHEVLGWRQQAPQDTDPRYPSGSACLAPIERQHSLLGHDSAVSTGDPGTEGSAHSSPDPSEGAACSPEASWLWRMEMAGSLQGRQDSQSCFQGEVGGGGVNKGQGPRGAGLVRGGAWGRGHAHQLRTVAIVLDEGGVSRRLLPLLGQVHEAPAERGQRPREAHGGEELEQVRPEDLGAVPWSVRPRGPQPWGGSPATPPQAPRSSGRFGQSVGPGPRGPKGVVSHRAGRGAHSHRSSCPRWC